MGSIVEEDQSSINGETIKWTSDTNWTVAQGSLHNSISIESSDCPINEPDPDFPVRNPPLVLKPPGTGSDPCEIKICFEQKYEVGLVYVRSSARIYEVYYARSPQGSSEYLCTVRCGVAERDDKVLTTASVEDASGENGGCSVGGASGSVASDGETTVSSEDDWVKIKIPEVEKSSLSDNTSINRVDTVQDLYEATAQISDAEACSFLTIRLLSLQDKSHVHVDEVYLFVDPAESTDSENVVPALSSAQSPLMAMLMPTLMQLSASGANRTTNKLELPKDDHVQSRLERASEVDGESKTDQVDTQYFKLKELDKDRIESDENQQPPLDVNTVKAGESTCINDHTQYLKLKELDKDTAELGEIEQPSSDSNSKKGGESTCINDQLPGCLERSLGLLLSRVRTVEDICLRFEEKMLKPIESMEAKLQQVEHQLETRLQQVEHKLETRLQKVELLMEKLSDKIENSALPRGTRITAPAFSLSESNCSSFYNEVHDCAINGASGIEKDSSPCVDVCPGLVDSSTYGDIRPGLVVTAPEFSCGEDEDNNGDFETPKDALPGSKPKLTLSVDDAFAAALSGFMSSSKSHQPENVETTSRLSSEEEKENKHMDFVEAHQIISQELPATRDCSRESLSHTWILSIKAPEFVEDEIGIDESIDCNQTSLDRVPTTKNEVDDHDETVAITENEVEGHDEDKVPPSTLSQNLFTSDMWDFRAKEKDHDEDQLPLSTHSGSLFTSSSNADLPIRDNEENDRDTCKFAHSTHTLRLLTDADFGDCDLDMRQDEPGSLSEHSVDSGQLDSICTNLSESSRSSALDFEFPILDVKFATDEYAGIKTPFESLLDGEPELNVQVPVYDSSVYGDVDDCITGDISGTRTADFDSSNSLLVDIECSSLDAFPYLEGVSDNPSTPTGSEMTVSLI